MAENEKIIQVKDLTISFRTNNGTVKAVRDISFDLNKGETLAIVGESGSGKSVTNRAIMGILANNKIIENGEILFEGKDLLKTKEEDFVKIRGAKIAMIFQDPMSSLNPIMKVGKQISESTILKGKADLKEAQKYLSIIDKIVKNNTDAEKAKVVEKYINAYCAEQEKIYHFNYATYYLDKSIPGLNAVTELLDMKGLNNASFYTSSNNFLTYFGSCFNDDVIKSDSKAHEAYLELVEITKNTDLGKIEIAEIVEKVRNLLATCKEAIDEFKNAPQKEYVDVFYKAAFGQEFSGSESELKQVEELKSEVVNILNEVTSKLNSEYDSKANAIIEAANSVKFSDFDKSSKKQYKAFNKILKDNMNPMFAFEETPDNLFLPSVNGYVDAYFNAIALTKKNEKDAEVKYQKALKEAAKNNSEQPVKAEPVVLDHMKYVEKANETLEQLVEFISSVSASKYDSKFNGEYLFEQMNKYCVQKVSKITKSMARDKALELMREVGIPFPEKRFEQYPFQFSGGMRQRIVIAIAIASNPRVLICDEPTTALDVTIQAQILELINKLKKERNLSIIFITHDLGVVANMADRIAVMYAGKIVEYGKCDEIFYEPRHPYTWALLSAMPDINSAEKLESIPGTPPNMLFPPKGDAFAARNKYAMKIDFEAQPPFFKVSDTHYAATWLLHPNAPKVNPPKIVTERINNMRKLAEEDYKESGEVVVDFSKNEYTSQN